MNAWLTVVLGFVALICGLEPPIYGINQRECRLNPKVSSLLILSCGRTGGKSRNGKHLSAQVHLIERLRGGRPQRPFSALPV